MPAPTNLIFFLSDNHNRQFLGSAGHPTVKTPALDSIAQRGVRFENAWCSSALCCPSRAAIATGRYPHQSGYWDNALAYDGRLPSWHHRVRDAGYQMTAIGKLHFRSSDDDNGFCEEIDTMHILDGKGALSALLRATQDCVPQRRAHRAIYEDSVVGEAEYQIYDRRIAAQAIEWLRSKGTTGKPWALIVSFPSPHPPFKVPQRFWDMYPLEDVPMPVQWRREERPDHPADAYIAWMNSLEDDFDEAFVRRVVAGYCGLISHTDEQIGRVLHEIEALGLVDNTRIVYTSDHGEAAGHHGILGKGNNYEHALGVPLLVAGPDVPQDRVVSQCASHVDLFPTILEAVGARRTDEDNGLKGVSLWPAIQGDETARPAFAEYHANGSRNSGFALRKDNFKLIYHVGMRRQLFDLESDPREERDLLADGHDHSMADTLESELRQMLDPEAIDARSKADQAAHMEKFGGVDAVRKEGMFSRSPIPGSAVELERADSP